MAGLECPHCAEETRVVSNGEILEDGTGKVMYQRFRTCINGACEYYLLRLATVEVYAAYQAKPYVLQGGAGRFRDCPPRTSPPPDGDLIGVNV